MFGEDWDRINPNLKHATLYVLRGLGQDEVELIWILDTRHFIFGEDWDKMKPSESEFKTRDTLFLERIGTEWSRI